MFIGFQVDLYAGIKLVLALLRYYVNEKCTPLLTKINSFIFHVAAFKTKHL